jgi:two-component system, OmpR family, sensor kinase
LGRLPIRLRLTLAFAAAMAVVLAATGAFLYIRLGSSLDEAIDEGLQARLADVSTLAAGGEPALGRTAADPGESAAQVLGVAGELVDATPGAERPLLTPAEVASLEPGGVVRLERGGLRLLATATEAGPRVVVGASLEDRDEALRGLLGQLLVGGPVALLLASLLGYGIARAALRPVESMRAEAAAISAAQPGRRLPLPRSRDEVGRLGETLNAMLDRLEAALERERSFVANASHELRTPLASLKAELDLALRRPRSPAELEQALRSAAAETDRLARLAEDLLVLARSDRGGLPLRRTFVPAHDVVAAVAMRFARTAEDLDRAIDVQAPDGLHVVADGLRLEQALGNLVANALEHGRGSIQVSAVETDGHIEFHVVDEGPGFPPAFLARAFERFSRADEARSGGGTGLGLAIAAVIASAHGGSAHAVNDSSGGADVWVSIPTARMVE